ncbi:MAG: hypothetical protein V4649_04680 [Bacteroidota bacterium]
MKKLMLLLVAGVMFSGAAFAEGKACCKKKGEKCAKSACCKDKKEGSAKHECEKGKTTESKPKA